MSYTKEQRAANAAKAAGAASAKSVEATGAQAVERAAVEQVETAIPAAEPPRPEPRNKPRTDAFAEIEAREARQREEAAALPQPQREEPAPEPVAAPVAAAATATQEPATAAATAPAAVEMVHVKVDGEEFDVPKAEVDEAGGLNAYQRDRASENRLKKANETLAQTRQLQEHIAQVIQKNTPKQPTLTDAQFIQSKIDTIRFGSAEESTAALQEVMSRGRLDEATIIQKAKMQMNQQAAIDNFGKEFQDVVSNPLLAKLAAALESERIGKLAPNANLGEFYRKIGNEVRSVAGPRPNQAQPAVAAAPAGTAVAAPTADSTSPASEREARKASIVNLPTAAARAVVPKEETPGTPEEQHRAVLNDMRKSRGLPTG